MTRKTQGSRVLVRIEHEEGRSAARGLRSLASTFLSSLGLVEAQLSLVVTTDARFRALNRRWRHKDRPTDVLSFPAAQHPHLAGRMPVLGDVVISLDTARRRAREDGRRLKAELARYLAHGVLHLLGHDHHEPAKARRMARAEERLLGGAGMLGAGEERDSRSGKAPQKTRPAPAQKKKSLR